MTGIILKAQVVEMTNILERKTKDKNSGIHILLPSIHYRRSDRYCHIVQVCTVFNVNVSCRCINDNLWIHVRRNMSYRQ